MIMGLLEKLIGNEKQKECKHLGCIKGNIKPKLQVCEECGKAGSLRICLTCGHMGCCDSSIGQHARKHFQKTGHAIMAVYPNREWKWCYVDNEYLY